MDHPTVGSLTVHPTLGDAVPPLGGSPNGRVYRLEAAPPGSGMTTTATASWHQKTWLDQAAVGMRSHDVLDGSPDLGNHLDAAGHQSVLEITGDGAADQDIDAELGDDPLAVGPADREDLGEGRLTTDDVDNHEPSCHVEERRYAAFPYRYGESHDTRRSNDPANCPGCTLGSKFNK